MMDTATNRNHENKGGYPEWIKILWLIRAGKSKYHIVFAAKYRRQIIYNRINKAIGQILRTLCERKGVTILAAEACPDQVHMLVEILPKYSVSEIMGYLKGKISLMIFDRHANLKYKYGNRHFWCRGHYVDTAGKNEKRIAEYVRNLDFGVLSDQLSFKEFTDMFAGEQVITGKNQTDLNRPV